MPRVDLGREFLDDVEWRRALAEMHDAHVRSRGRTLRGHEIGCRPAGPLGQLQPREVPRPPRRQRIAESVEASGDAGAGRLLARSASSSDFMASAYRVRTASTVAAPSERSCRSKPCDRAVSIAEPNKKAS